MIEFRGAGRGSYIFGMSIHNTQIERLWFDVTRGFGQIWKNFFIDLEIYHGLNPRNPVHIWLLHHLFLQSIRADAALWVEAWNSHTMQLPRGQTNASPREMFVFSMVENGPRGFSVDELQDDEEAAGYGVDWEALNDNPLMAHFQEQNPAEPPPPELNDLQPFTPNVPHRMSEVLCEAPNCPLTDELVRELDRVLAERVDLFSTQMGVRRLVWQEAFSLCSHFYGTLNPA
ncbi:hypothetical protein CPB83DRAFT_769166 [Crepidotus variabilis]|uniref:Integrase core domain-containing protein n=1 Tax=Crepidotus variabilis TaxID=179855 RepID=A0A9P6EDK6_9AGAR|nr:hypothetical protein CPB83DRAFT_769166 [Crepidotus variabilis]